MTGKSLQSTSYDIPTETDLDLSSESRLWRAVLNQAISDIALGRDEDRLEVIAWVDGNDFDAVCLLAEIDSVPLKEELLSLAMLPARATRKFFYYRLKKALPGFALSLYTDKRCYS